MEKKGLYKTVTTETQRDVLKVLIHDSIFLVEGEWRVDESDEQKRLQGLGSNISFDFLISIDGVNYLIYPEDLQVFKSFASMQPSNKQTEIEVRIVSPQGSISRLSVNGKLASSHSSGNPELLTHELFQKVIESEIVALSILEPVRDGGKTISDFKWVMANNLQKAIAKGKELIGRRYSEVFPFEFRNGTFELLKKVVESGERASNEFYYEDHNVRGWFKGSYVSVGPYVLSTAEDVTLSKSTEEELRQSNQKLEAAFNVSSTALVIMRAKRNDAGFIADFVCEWMNHAGINMIGYDATGLHLSSTFPALAKRDVFDLLVSVATSNHTVDFETSTAQGSRVVWHYWKAVKLNDGLFLSIENITQRKIAESERITLIENSPDVICRYDRDLKLVFANSAFSLKMGVQIAESVGRTLSEIPLAKSLAAPMMETLQNVFTTAEPQTHYHSFNAPPGEVHFFYRFVPELDHLGNVQSVLAIGRDITELKHSEEELLKNLKIVKQTEAVAGLGSWEYVPEHDQLTWSEGMYKLFNLSVATPITPETYLEFVVDDDKHIATKFIDTLRKSLSSFEDVLRIRVSGEQKTLKISSSVVYNEHLKPVKVVGVDFDISALTESERLKELNAKLREVDREKTKFFNNVSHEFRTPITLLLGPLEEVIRQSNSASSQQPKLEMIYRNALRLQKLVNSVLDVSKIEAGRFDAIFQPADIAKQTIDLASNFRSAIEGAGIKLSVKVDKIDEHIYLNLEMWEKIVLNLLSNALKYTHEGKISVMIKQKKWHVQLHVKDTGIGIAKNDMKRIFDRFVRVEGVTARVHEGTGIGLALVKELVGLHRGSIKLKSNPGKGSEFIVSIPKGKNHLPARQIYEKFAEELSGSQAKAFAIEALSWLPDRKKRSNRNLSSGARQKPLVLVVDDNADMRTYLSHVLEANYTIISAENGRSAIKKLEDGIRPALILADVMMPVMDGHELVNAVRENTVFAGIPVILISARASETDKIEGLRHGADDYIFKPFSARELEAVVSAKIESVKERNLAAATLRARNEELDALVLERTNELQKSKDLIAKQSTLLQSVLDAIPQMVWVLDTDGRIQFLNDRWYTYTGLTEAQCAEQNPYLCDIYHKSQQEEITARWADAVERRQRNIGEVLIRSASGQYRWHLDITEPIFNENGELEMWVGTFTDVHDQFVTERQAKETRDLLQAVLDSTTYSIELLEPIKSIDGKVIDLEWRFVNKRKAQLEKNAGLVGKRLKRDSLVIMNDAVFRKYAQVLETGEQVDFEFQLDTEEGKRWFLTMCVKVTDRLLVTQIDITDQVLARQRLISVSDTLQQKNSDLRVANEELTNFAFIASHDLKEPLRKIQLFTNTLAEREQSVSPKGRDYINRILASVTRMNALIDDILAFSRANASGKKRLEIVDLNEVFSNALNELSDKVHESNAVVNCEVLPKIKGNALQLSQLFQNLMLNSLKFQAPDSTPMLEVRVARIKGSEIKEAEVNPNIDYYKITFKDNGIGFDMQYANKIFLMFQRLHPKAQFPGTGMGLAICKRVIQNHNGFISAFSRAGDGAVFNCYFPALDTDL